MKSQQQQQHCKPCSDCSRLPCPTLLLCPPGGCAPPVAWTCSRGTKWCVQASADPGGVVPTVLTTSLEAGRTLSNCGQLVGARAGCCSRHTCTSVGATQAVAALLTVHTVVGGGIPSSWAAAGAIISVDSQGSLALDALVATRGGVQHTPISSTACWTALVDLLQQATLH